MSHTLRDGNLWADFMLKLGTSSDNKLLYNVSHPIDLLHLFKMDASETFYLF